MIFDLIIRGTPDEVARHLIPLVEMLGAESIRPHERHFMISDYLRALAQFGVYAGEFIEDNDPTLLIEHPKSCRRLIKALNEMSSAADDLRRDIESTLLRQPKKRRSDE